MKEYINKQNKLLTDKAYSYVIPKERKKYILAELDKLGVSQKTLFPEIDHQAKYIINSLDKKSVIAKEYDVLKSEIEEIKENKEKNAEEQISNLEQKKELDKTIRPSVTKYDTVIEKVCISLVFNKSNKYRRILLTHQNFFLRQIGIFLILKKLHTDYLLRSILSIMVFQLMKQKKLLLK